MSVYRGYVKLKGDTKKSEDNFKQGVKLKSLEEVQDEAGYAGVISDEYILIDIDDSEESEILTQMLKDFNINSKILKTTRGKHFYFKNKNIKKCFTGTKLVNGLTADIKSGKTNVYGILKHAGELREVISDPEVIDEIPYWLNPIKTNFNFKGLIEGDGRNGTLFPYILPLQGEGYTKEEIRFIIKMINDYILSEPMEESEIDVILRDEAFSEEIFFNKGTFLFDRFSKFMIANDYIVKINNQLHVYYDGVYKGDNQLIERKMIDKIPLLNRAKRNEVLQYINLLCENKVVTGNENLIAFNNCVYDIAKDEELDFNPDFFVTNKINWNYNADAYHELADKTLDKISCYDPEIRALLEELIGYCFYRRNELRKAVILTGNTVNGKSTYLDVISHILGADNISALDLKELDQRFKTAELYGKLANIGDDIEDSFIPNTAIFKKLVSGDRINIERKGQDPFDFSNYSKLIFSANNIPRIGSGKDIAAIANRLIIIPFNAKFTADDPDFDPFIKYKLREREAVEYFIKLGIEGLKRILINQGFTRSEQVQKELEIYERTNNPIIDFIEWFGGVSEINNQSTNNIYIEYQGFCMTNGYTPLGHSNFTKTINDRLGMESVNTRIGGRQYRTFVKLDLGEEELEDESGTGENDN